MIINEKTPTELKKSDFYYDLPKELIAQTPVEPRDSSRLMRVDRRSGEVSHHVFRDISDMLFPGDVLVINDSRVIPARLYGRTKGGGQVETVLLRQRGADLWEALVRPGKKCRPGDALFYGSVDAPLDGVVTDVVDDGNRIIKFDTHGREFFSLLDEIGQMPLPPYITEKLSDRERYQTVYARERGSAAAPTAGLHFTPELLGKLREKGVVIAPVMLHVGLGTFRPVKEERIADHVMHTEFFSVSEETARAVNERKGRLIAVGTTSCRVLESAADENGVVRPMTDDTGIFIYPGYGFRAVEGLITNFHLPESTLLMLVSAFSSREIMMRAYAEAIKERYRFFSFGDAMFIV
ncbi:MAG: tRNA preQ1(34) S-adenosylmethionine ribosyltransferase-isomerase QueA [Clostridia bacterium]|nr:tRNA preQ1(34) S-adenosylmethionine ribosyltransferase-isomerase QueA [Clostridia bacterium]